MLRRAALLMANVAATPRVFASPAVLGRGFVHSLAGSIRPTASRWASNSTVGSYVGLKASAVVHEAGKYSADFRQDHLVLEYHASEKGVSVAKDFPYVWLKDRCRCAKCFNQKTQENDTTPLGLGPLDVTPAEASFERNTIRVSWPDGHESSYDLEELARTALLPEIRKKMPPANAPIFWNKQILVERANGFPQIDYQSYTNNPAVLNQALESILKYGAVIVKNVPAIEGEIVNVVGRIAPIQQSLYGSGYCVVRSNLEFSDRAYTSAGLMYHTDNTYMKNTAGLEAFHVIEPAPVGGDSQIIDGFYCAEQLRQRHPKDFEILAKTTVESEYFKVHFEHMKHRSKVIELDEIDPSTYLQIRYNCYNKLNLNHLSRSAMLDYYRALQTFASILDDPANSFWTSLKPDQVLIFNNFRVLHGRSEVKGKRTLVTAYLPYDEWLSKARLRKLID